MSLSVPYVLAAAVDVAPAGLVRCAGRSVPVAELASTTASIVSRLASAGFTPGRRRRVAGRDLDALVERVAAARCGVVLAAVDDPGPAEVCHLDVVEQRVWSQTPLLEGPGGHVVTHGMFLEALHADTVAPDWPDDLVTVVSDLIALGSAS